MKADDDDPAFDARLHWSSQNNEYIAPSTLMEKKKFDGQMRVLGVLKKTPMGSEDVAKELGIRTSEVRSAIHFLGKMGVQIYKERVNYRLVYMIKSCPDKILFRPSRPYHKLGRKWT